MDTIRWISSSSSSIYNQKCCAAINECIRGFQKVAADGYHGGGERRLAVISPIINLLYRLKDGLELEGLGVFIVPKELRGGDKYEGSVMMEDDSTKECIILLNTSGQCQEFYESIGRCSGVAPSYKVISGVGLPGDVGPNRGVIILMDVEVSYLKYISKVEEPLERLVVLGRVVELINHPHGAGYMLLEDQNCCNERSIVRSIGAGPEGELYLVNRHPARTIEGDLKSSSERIAADWSKFNEIHKATMQGVELGWWYNSRAEGVDSYESAKSLVESECVTD